MVLKAVFIIKEYNYMRLLCFILLTQGKLFIKIFEQDVFTFVVTYNVAHADRLIVNMRQHTQPINLVSVLSLCNKEKLNIRLKMAGANINNDIFHNPEAIAFRADNSECVYFFQIAENRCIVNVLKFLADFLRLCL